MRCPAALTLRDNNSCGDEISCLATPTSCPSTSYSFDINGNLLGVVVGGDSELQCADGSFSRAITYGEPCTSLVTAFNQCASGDAGGTSSEGPGGASGSDAGAGGAH